MPPCAACIKPSRLNGSCVVISVSTPYTVDASRRMSSDGLITILPPPGDETVVRRAEELLESGRWARAVDPSTGADFFYDVSSPLLRTWNLKAWVEHQIVLQEAMDARSAGSAIEQQSPGEEASRWREKIIELYSKHNPTKLLVVDELLARYAGRELELWRNLMSKYGSRASPTASPRRAPVVDSPRTSSRSPQRELTLAEPDRQLASGDPETPSQPTSRVVVTPESREAAETKARALLAASRSHRTSTPPTMKGRSPTPTKLSGRPPTSARSPRGSQPDKRSPTPRHGSPSTGRQSPAPGSKIPSDDPRWADELARRAAEVAARREEIAAEKRRQRETRAASVAARAEEHARRPAKSDGASTPSMSPVQSFRGASGRTRDRVSLIDRQSQAALNLRARYTADAPRDGEFDASSPASGTWRPRTEIGGSTPPLRS